MVLGTKGSGKEAENMQILDFRTCNPLGMEDSHSWNHIEKHMETSSKGIYIGSHHEFKSSFTKDSTERMHFK